MKRQIMATVVALPISLLLCSQTFAEDANNSSRGDVLQPLLTPGAASGQSRWRVRGGLMWRRVGSLSVNPNLQNGSYNSGLPSTTVNVGEPGVYADRTYLDGFVNIGAFTPATGQTTNWGYSNASQVSGQTISFTSAPMTALANPAAGKDHEHTTQAPYLELAYLQQVRPNLEAGFSIQFSYTGLDNSMTSQMMQTAVTTVDTYDAAVGVIIPGAGYTGSFSGPGTLLPNQPTTRSQNVVGAGSQIYSFDSDTDIYSLAFGGEVNWQVSERFSVGAAGGIVINYVDWNASWSAPVFSGGGVSSASFSNRGDELLGGLYLKGSVSYHINENWDFEGFFRYDWSESFDGKVNGSEFNMDLSGWSRGIGLSYRF